MSVTTHLRAGDGDSNQDDDSGHENVARFNVE